MLNLFIFSHLARGDAKRLFEHVIKIADAGIIELGDNFRDGRFGVSQKLRRIVHFDAPRIIDDAHPHQFFKNSRQAGVAVRSGFGKLVDVQLQMGVV